MSMPSQVSWGSYWRQIFWLFDEHWPNYYVNAGIHFMITALKEDVNLLLFWFDELGSKSQTSHFRLWFTLTIPAEGIN
jgi:hypothetical protein